MNPIVGVVAGYPVYVFPLLLNVGLVVALALAGILARRRGVAPAALLDVAVWVLPAGLIGARLVYAATNWEEYAANPLTALSLWEGGLSLPGAITAGLAVAALAVRRQRLPLGTCLDAAAAALPFGQAIGRLGCLVAGCAVGQPVPEDGAWPALPLPDSTGLVALRFPSQLFESGADLALGALLLWLWSLRLRPGAVMAAYAAGYGVLRTLAEPLRADVSFLGPLTLGQWWGAAAAAAGCAVLLRRVSLRRRAPPAGTPTYAGDA